MVAQARPQRRLHRSARDRRVVAARVAALLHSFPAGMNGYVLFWAGAALLLSSSIAYPLWVALLARLRPVPVRAFRAPDEQLPAVTCVIAAADEAALVGRKLQVLAEQDYPRDKLAVFVVS